MILFKVIKLIILIILSLNSSKAYPNRPGSCRAGNPVGGTHIEGDRFGTFNYAGYEITFLSNNQILFSEIKLTTNQEYNLDLHISAIIDEDTDAAIGGFLYWRGSLLRLSAKDPDIDASKALYKPYEEWRLEVLPSKGEIDGANSSCHEHVAGLGHNNFQKKQQAFFNLYFEAPGEYLLEVTLVHNNRDEVRDGYYKEDYTIIVE